MAPALSEFWFQTDLGRENSASFLKYSGGSPFLTMVTRWSRSTSNFYALIGQNLTGEFMRKIRDLKIQRRDGNENVAVQNRISDFDKRRISQEKKPVNKTSHE